ncbi:MAG: hypothetical protein JNK51_06730 [Blastocatellia bacterium]|nr:hypothetical protein [Chloracidobacterium sp.]MBL8184603.1 hypothetical protein [Blastocatellia bacterium]HRJ89513.1 hypothetical protein [Pyrinomonadaceae bacterium]HRK50704.1 hypothetical protein [Pyrinomonadaceae bacterium]
MNVSRQLSTPIPKGSPNFIYGIAILWGVVAIIVFTLILLEIGFDDPLSRFYLVPWALATGVVVVLPSVLLIKRGKFDLFHPLVFATWSYFFPGFVIGGFVLAAGLSQPYFLSFVQDDRYNLPLTFVYVMLGYGGLAIGFSLHYGKVIGDSIFKFLPSWNWKEDKVAVPGLILLGIGMANTVIAFGMGLIGFQKVDEIGAFDGIIFLFSLFLLEASFFLWLYIFRSRHFGAMHYIVLGLLLATAIGRTAFQGNRGGLIHLLILVGCAFVLSGRKITAKHHFIGGILVTLALVIGMIYGTTFRQIKGSQEQASLSQIGSVVVDTMESLSSGDIDASLSRGFGALAERLDSISSLAVIVSNYEALAPYEELWGINNNIWVDTITFFIPRAIWADKPISIEPSKYADLYFNYSENSFTMTPMGDLLRNFGPIGVPLGMIVLGFLLRIIYAALIEGKEFAYWRACIYYMILTAISYEGTYGLIVPYLSKVLVISFVGMLLIRFFIGKSPTALPLAKP